MEKNEHLFKKRHSLSHLLAMAVLEFDPEVKLAIGPVIDNGFYYDFEFSQGKIPSADMLKKFEKEVKKLIGKNLDFNLRDLSDKEAREIFKDQPYKIELIDELVQKGEKLTGYKTASFFDLCRGPHVENTKEIDQGSFKISHIAGAYWRGDEKNTMLTRIYGLAFDTKEELDAYIAQQEEAKRRDHRKLGKDLDLFTISELVGSGLPLFTPKGTVLREMIASYSQELQGKYGFERVWTPHMARTELYKHSGHYEKYPERFEVTSAESSDVFMLKPMNCPHHAQLFARKPWSYRELPVRYMENTTNYRDEKHGELHGLSRVRSLSQDDGHVFCQESHCEEEIRNIINMIKQLYSALGLDYYVRLSYRDDSEKFLGDKETWKRAESIISKVAKEENLKTTIALGEAAFYGPKLDYLVKDSLGREWQCATIQLDFVQPERFGLTYVDSDGKEKRPVMIHKALLGSIERFISVYIEHTAGIFPLWVSPLQVKVIPVLDSHNEYARKVFQMLRDSDFRVELDDSDKNLGKKIRAAKVENTPYIIVIGDKEIEANKITLESRDKGNLGLLSAGTVVEKLCEEIKNKNV